MTRWLAPSICTWTPAKPEPLTRLVMISWACCMDAVDGSLPSAVWAVSVTCVPPCRSMPSFGLLEPFVKKTSA